jgi:hypothetical protein
MKDYSFVSSLRDWTKVSFLKVSNHGTATYNNLSSMGLVDLILNQVLFDDLLTELKRRDIRIEGLFKGTPVTLHLTKNLMKIIPLRLPRKLVLCQKCT